MRSSDFEKRAKDAVIRVLGEKIDACDLEMVWFTQALGHKKCMICGEPMGDRYAEVTYNSRTFELYVDIYCKVLHREYELRLPAIRSFMDQQPGERLKEA